MQKKGKVCFRSQTEILFFSFWIAFDRACYYCESRDTGCGTCFSTGFGNNAEDLQLYPNGILNGNDNLWHTLGNVGSDDVNRP